MDRSICAPSTTTTCKSGDGSKASPVLSMSKHIQPPRRISEQTGLSTASSQTSYTYHVPTPALVPSTTNRRSSSVSNNQRPFPLLPVSMTMTTDNDHDNDHDNAFHFDQYPPTQIDYAPQTQEQRDSGKPYQQQHHFPVTTSILDTNSCIDATAMITSMAGAPIEEVRAGLGCFDRGDCQVMNQVVFDVMDRYSETQPGL